MNNYKEMFRDRALAVAEAVGGKVWRWEDFKKSEGFQRFYGKDTLVSWRRKNDKQGTVQFGNIQPLKVDDLVKHDAFVLDSELIDSVSVVVDNRNSSVDIGYHYNAEFAKVVTEEEAFSAGFSVSVRNCFTAGNDASPVKNETEITAEAHSDFSKGSSETSSVSRGSGFDITIPGGKRVKIWATRSIEKQRRKITGKGTFTHDVAIGRHWDGEWKSKGTRKWDTYEEFLNAFSNKDLLKPVYNHFEQYIDYDNVTSVDLYTDEF